MIVIMIILYNDNDNNDNNNTSILYDIIYIHHISYSLFILTVPSRDSGLAHSAHTWPNSSSASGSPVATPKWELEPPAAGGSSYGGFLFSAGKCSFFFCFHNFYIYI